MEMLFPQLAALFTTICDHQVFRVGSNLFQTVGQFRDLAYIAFRDFCGKVFTDIAGVDIHDSNGMILYVACFVELMETTE